MDFLWIIINKPIEPTTKAITSCALWILSLDVALIERIICCIFPEGIASRIWQLCGSCRVTVGSCDAEIWFKIMTISVSVCRSGNRCGTVFHRFHFVTFSSLILLLRPIAVEGVGCLLRREIPVQKQGRI